jgi:iron(III) transport system permease protein
MTQDVLSAVTKAGSREATRKAFADPTRIAVVALGILLGLLVIPPLWFLLVGSVHTTTETGALGEFTWRYYQRLAADQRFFTSLQNSIVFAIGSAAFAILLGGMVAWVVERTNAPFKSFAYLTAIISLGTPYVLYVTAWLFLLGRNGPLNEWLRWASGGNDLQFTVSSMTGMVLIEGLLWSPMSFLLLASVFRSSNSDFEEAAQMSGAGVGTVLRRISLRLAMPAIAAVGLLVVIRSIEAFEVPALVGLPGKVRLLTTDIYLDMKQTVPPDFGYSSAFSLVLLLIASGLLWFYARLSRNAARYHTVTGRAFRPRLFDLGWARPLGGALILLNFFLVLVLPNAALLWQSLMPFSQSFSLRGLGLLTLANYRTVFSAGSYGPLVWQTLLIAAASATCVLLVTVIAAWLSVRRKPGAAVLDHLATAPLVFPGIVLGVAMMQIFLSLPVTVYGTIWAFIIAFTVRYLPYGMRYASSGILQIHTELEESATISGATGPQILWRIVVPLAVPAIAAGWLFIFLVSARDLSLAVILASPSVQPVAVAMLDLWSNGQGTELAAFGLVWTAIMTLIASLFYWLTRRASAAGLQA